MTSIKTIFGILAVAIVLGIFFFFFSSSNADSSLNCQPIHWHPKLKIAIDSEPYPIPADIGIREGKIIDTDVSGMAMSPTHTHSSDGIIHMENNCPQKKPETYTLGYFFKVWNKPFSRNCIFEYCENTTHRLRMLVNNQENTEFENYRMQDGDEIEIRYEEIP